MDLTSGSLLWPTKTTTSLQAPRLETDIKCDVVVIGAGITGSLLADELTRRGRDVVVLDRRSAGLGSTSASTGLLMYDLDTPLFQLIDLVGKDHARRAYRLCFEALDRIETLVSGLGDDCGLVRRPILYLASHKSDVTDLQAECDARREAGFQVELLTHEDIQSVYGFDRPAGLWGPRAMEVDPFRLVQRLLQRAINQGLRAYFDTEVTEYAPDSTGVTLKTKDGATVRALRIVFATGYETPEFIKQKVCTLHSTWALASQPLPDVPGWKDRCMIWEAARPYFYLRSGPDDRIIIGGEDERFKSPALRDALNERKTAKIVKTFGTLFPDIELRPEFAWSGTFAETKDGMPYIGQLDDWPRGLFALGYGGNGITFSVLAARILPDLVVGIRNDDAEVFRFGR